MPQQVSQLAATNQPAECWFNKPLAGQTVVSAWIPAFLRALCLITTKHVAVFISRARG